MITRRRYYNREPYKQKVHKKCGECLHGEKKNLQNFQYNPAYVCNIGVVGQVYCRENEYSYFKKDTFLSEEEMII